MIEKIKKTYDGLDILMSALIEKEFRHAFKFTNINCDDIMSAKCSCSKYAKFLINDFKSLENKYGKEIYTIIDGGKLNALFAISETHSWFSRKELVEFLETELNVLAPKLESWD